MENEEKKKRIRNGVIIALILLLAISLIGGTLARYSSTGKADAKAEIAKWAVTMKSGDTTLSSTSKDITFTVQSNSNVVPGKIAPSVTAVAEVELDLTGTEVAVDFTATVGSISPSNLPSSDKISLTSSVDGGTPGTTQTIPLVNSSAFTAQNGKKKVTLTLEWENDDTNNADDTSTGTTGGTITIPVTLTVQQHIN